MFCDLVGSTALSARLDPEDLRDVIAVYNAAVDTVIKKHNGFVARYMGDGVMAYFGYPRANEDDAERAVRAGLELLDRVCQLELAFGKPEIRIGIATGLVVVGDLIGTGDTQERNVVGETPNIAARLQNLAEPNTILISDGTRRLIGDLFECHNLGALDLKGLPGRVLVWRVLGPGIIESRFEALRATSLTNLVGRDEEIELLLRRWNSAKQGDGQIVLISGEPGIGKSRIAATLQERLGGEPHAKLDYFASPYHVDSPLHPFTAQLERTARFARGDSPQTKLDKLEALLSQSQESALEAVALLADLLMLPSTAQYPALPSDPRRRRELTLALLIRQLQDLASRQPVLVIFEDAQWIDSTSLELLEIAVQRASGLRMLWLITFRPEFHPPWTGQAHVTMLTLNRLGRRETAALAIRVASGKALPFEILDEIVERADGIPLFVEELTKTVLESGLLREEDSRYSLDHAFPALAIPSSLHDSLMARLDRLAPAREVAQIGAAIGREFSYEVLAGVARRTDAQLRSAVDQLVDAGLIFSRGVPPHASLIFKHALIQDAAYGTLLRSQRRELHIRIGTLLEEKFPEMALKQPEILAHHHTEGGLADPAIEYWRKAGELALRRSAIVEATKHLRRGLELIPLLPEGSERDCRELGLALPLAQATWAVKGHKSETLHMFTRARELSGRSATIAEQIAVLHGLWRVQLHRGELVAARELAQQCLELAEPHGNAETLGQASRQLGTTFLWMGMFVEARELLSRALHLHSLCQENTSTDSLFRAGNTRSTLGVTLWPLGYPDQAIAAALEALAEARACGHMVGTGITLRSIALLETELGACPPSATNHTDDAVAHCAEHLKMYEPWLRFDQGILLARRGNPRKAIEVMQASMTAAEEFNAELGRTVRLGHLAAAHASCGQPEVGLVLLDNAMVMVEQTQERLFEGELNRLRGELLIQLDRKGEAQAALKRALTVAQSQQAPMWELRTAKTLAQLFAALGKRREAYDLLKPIHQWFGEGFQMPDLREASALLDELR